MKTEKWQTSGPASNSNLELILIFKMALPWLWRLDFVIPRDSFWPEVLQYFDKSGSQILRQ